jgi:CubicO group peptidase (beta-lactamase class C family)
MTDLDAPAATDDDAGPDRGERRRPTRWHRIGGLGGRGVVAGIILAVGALWLLTDLATDDDPATTGDTFERIDAYVADQLDDARIPGAAIAIVQDGTPVHAAGYGENGRGDPVTVDTPFWIGSNTKSITALAVMQLVEAGTVDLDTPIQRYLPDFGVADPEASTRITVRHLLNQTSGISRLDSIRAVATTSPDQNLEDTVAGLAGLDLNRPVGDSFEYANLNSVVLGLLIERVSGQRWQDYVQTNIFDPLAMTSTYTDKSTAAANGLTATHRHAFGFPFESDGTHLPGLAPTGYVYSTADDMARYLALYTRGGTLDGQALLSDAGIAQMLTAATDERTFQLQSQQFTASYGAGWFVGAFGAATDARWHQGSLPHFTAWMVLLPETNQAIVVLLNAGNQFEIGGANAAWSRIPQGIVNLLRDQPPPTGTSTARFFIVFDTAVALAAALLVGHLVRVIGRPLPASTPRALLPLIGEIALPAAALVAYPALTGGLGWRTALTFLPDLTITVAVLGALALAAGTVRLVRYAVARNR